MKDPCLPVGYCFPASIPLFMEDYSIDIISFHIPQGLPLTLVVPIIYLSYSNTSNICPIVVDHGTIDNY